jgi:hypothetical protein
MRLLARIAGTGEHMDVDRKDVRQNFRTSRSIVGVSSSLPIRENFSNLRPRLHRLPHRQFP